MKKETLAIRTQNKRTDHQEHSVPLYMTSSYVFEDAEDMRAQFAEEKQGEIYSRYANPNVQEFIDKIESLIRRLASQHMVSALLKKLSLLLTLTMSILLLIVMVVVSF